MLRDYRRGWQVLILIGAASLCGCSQSPAPETKAPATQKGAGVAQEAQPAGGAAADQAAEDATVLAVSKAIRKNRLTDKADECIAYQFDPTSLKDAYVVEVRENHRYAKCGGDPNTSPRMFTVRVAKTGGALSTDSGSAAGEFHPLPN